MPTSSNVVEDLFSHTVCVKECPTKTNTAKVECVVNGKQETGTNCVPAKTPLQTAAYDSTEIGPYCLPTSYNGLPKKAKDAV